MSTHDAHDNDRFLTDKEPFFVPLKIEPHFSALSEREKQYAHSISNAAFAGTMVVLRQVSPEAETIYKLIIELHRDCKGDYTALKSTAEITDDEMAAYLAYAGMFLGNCGNYKAFGDTKFIPRINANRLEAIVKTSSAAHALFKQCRDALYSLDRRDLGFPAEGHMSSYYPDSLDITKAEIDEVQSVLKENGCMPENTRLRKTPSGDFELLVASGTARPVEAARDFKQGEYGLIGTATNGKKLRIVYGDHEHEMERIAKYMQQAEKLSANEHQKAMHAAYVDTFRTGSMAAFDRSQREWIKDQGPVIECNIGFIETYRDPSGTRAEWEGFAAIVNKERTKTFAKLVESAPEFLPKLPWPATFEKDKFLKPDFTSLEVLTFAGSGIPAGINIPNDNAIRQSVGFKNVSLGNVLSSSTPKDIPFLDSKDKELYVKHREISFEVQVGLHELLGHGSGKMFQETTKGVYDFDMDKPCVNPVTKKPIDSWYKLGETWGSVFGGAGPSYEECRAECVAMSLGCDFEVLSIYGFDGTTMDSEAGDVMYIMYLQMARAGIASLEFWDPKSRKWGQAHMQARFAILKAMLKGGKEFCRIEHDTGEDGTCTNLRIILDRNKIISHGRPAVDHLLTRLQVFKATADVKRGLELYNEYTNVDEWFAEKVRPEVLRQKQPRKSFVQANTILEGETVKLVEYEASAEGMIQSYADRTYVY